MVSPLKYFKSDPMKKGRGKGWYYNRTINGKKHFSKYSGVRDGRKKDTKSTPVSPRYEHAGDRSIRRRKRHTVKPSKRAKGKSIFGWF